MDRRSVMKGGAALLVMGAGGAMTEAAWARAPIPGQIFDPRRFGAVGDGKTLDTQAIQKAIDTCTQSGGGTVSLGPGTYVTGTITLKSHVTLELQQGATILASPFIANFFLPMEGFAATKGVQGQHLIFALNAENIALVGPGVVDGNGPAYFETVPRNITPADYWKDASSKGTRRITPISPMVELANCTNVRVENITLQNAVGWTLHPVGCKQVLIKQVKVRNPLNASNTDGIDPSCCVDALVTDCDVITGDDGICVKTFNQYGGNLVSENITVKNCRVSTSCNALKLGQEGVSPFRTINFMNCEVYSLAEPSTWGTGKVNDWVAAGIDVNIYDHSSIDGVTFTGITMTNARTPIFIRLQKALARPNRELVGTLRNVSITDVKASGAMLTSSITGIQGMEVENVRLTNIAIDTVEQGQVAWTLPPVVENETGYPGPAMFGRLPAYGFYVRHVEGLAMDNVTVRSRTRDPRPMLVCDDVRQLSLKGVGGTASSPAQPFFDLIDTQAVRVSGCVAPAGTGVYARISGAKTEDVVFRGNDLKGSRNGVVTGPEVVKGQVGVS